MGRKCKQITVSEDVIKSFENCNMERLYATLIKIMERKYDIKIAYEFRKKTPEELAMDREKENNFT